MARGLQGDDESDVGVPVYDLDFTGDTSPDRTVGPAELLTHQPGPHHRGLIALGALVVVALAATLITRLVVAGHDTVRLAPTPGTSSTPDTAPVLGREVSTGTGSVASLAVSRRGVLFLQHGPDRVSLLPSGGSGPVDFAHPPVGTLRVVADSDGDHVWTLAPSTMSTIAVRSYDLRSTGRLTSAPYTDYGLPGNAELMSAVDGVAWVASDAGLFAAGSRHAGAFDVGAVQAMAPDPTRHRVVLVARRAGASAVWVASVGSDGRPAVRRLGAVPIEVASLAATPNALWVSGVSGRESTVLQLDPTNARVGIVTTDSGTSVAATLVGGGTVLWSITPTALECLSGSRGETQRTWDADVDAVASGPNEIFVVVDGRLQQVSSSSRCPG